MYSITEKASDRICKPILSLHFGGNTYTLEICFSSSPTPRSIDTSTGIFVDNIDNIDNDDIFSLSNGVKIGTSRNGPMRRRLGK